MVFAKRSHIRPWTYLQFLYPCIYRIHSNQYLHKRHHLLWADGEKIMGVAMVLLGMYSIVIFCQHQLRRGIFLDTALLFVLHDCLYGATWSTQGLPQETIIKLIHAFTSAAEAGDILTCRHE